MKIIGIIPVRYLSRRFPSTPVTDICGKPMIWGVYQQAIKVKEFDEVYVATDDENYSARMLCTKFKNGVDLINSSTIKLSVNNRFELIYMSPFCSLRGGIVA